MSNVGDVTRGVMDALDMPADVVETRYEQQQIEAALRGGREGDLLLLPMAAEQATALRRWIESARPGAPVEALLPDLAAFNASQERS